MLTPAMEALGESARFFILQCEEQLAGLIWLHCLHMLDIYLRNKHFQLSVVPNVPTPYFSFLNNFNEDLKLYGIYKT